MKQKMQIWRISWIEDRYKILFGVGSAIEIGDKLIFQ